MPDVPRPAPRPGPPPGARPRPSAQGRPPAAQPGPSRPPRDEFRAAGPLQAVISVESGRLKGAGRDASSLIVLGRIAFFDPAKDRLAEQGKRAMLRWACEHKLGQQADLVTAVATRRAAALRAMRASRSRLRLRAEPEWRLVTGLGDKANAHEIGLALHGTYGWPVIPGSSLKGLAAAWARDNAPLADVQRVLGTPRPGSRRDAATRGTVCFLDAIPAGQPAEVLADVLTPHVKPYYDRLAAGADPLVPPAEYHNPIPVTFLTVRGRYAVDLYGTDRDDLDLAARWLTEAGDDLGAGAKTAAGYGYLRVTPAPDQGGQP
jgi:CRISPR-associated protein Cmr6